MEITLYGRLAYADIWKARPPKTGDGPPKFGATLIIEPKSLVRGGEIKQSKLINDTIKKVAKEKWKDKADGILRKITGDHNRFCYFEEDYETEDGEVPDGFEGNYYLRGKSDIQPTIIDRDRTELTQRDGRPYAGCFVIMKADIWAQDNTHGKGIRCQIKGIQFLKDGDAFGGGTRSKADDFEDLSDLGDEDDGDEAPRGRRRAREDDEDERPARRKPARRSRDEDDDDDIA